MLAGGNLAVKNTFEKPKTLGAAEKVLCYGAMQNRKGFDQMAGPETIEQTAAPDVDENIV